MRRPAYWLDALAAGPEWFESGTLDYKLTLAEGLEAAVSRLEEARGTEH